MRHTSRVIEGTHIHFEPYAKDLADTSAFNCQIGCLDPSLLLFQSTHSPPSENTTIKPIFLLVRIRSPVSVTIGSTSTPISEMRLKIKGNATKTAVAELHWPSIGDGG